MPCSMTQHSATGGDQTHDLSVRNPMLPLCHRASRSLFLMFMQSPAGIQADDQNIKFEHLLVSAEEIWNKKFLNIQSSSYKTRLVQNK